MASRTSARRSTLLVRPTFHVVRYAFDDLVTYVRPLGFGPPPSSFGDETATLGSFVRHASRKNQKVRVLPSIAFHATSKCDPNAAAVITADSPEVFSLSMLSVRETTYIGGFQPPTTVDTCRFSQPLRVLTSPAPLFRRAPAPCGVDTNLAGLVSSQLRP